MGFYEGWPCFVERNKLESLPMEARRYGICVAEHILAMQEGMVETMN